MQPLSALISWELLEEARHQAALAEDERADEARRQVELEWLAKMTEDSALVEHLISDPPTDHGGRGYASAWASFCTGVDGEVIRVLGRHYEGDNMTPALRACNLGALSPSVAALVRAALETP